MGIQSPNEYYWEATYEDGTELKQFENGQEVPFNDIDQDRLDIFGWVNEDEDTPNYYIDLKDWQRLIAFRRHTVTSGKDRIQVYALGWQATINGNNYKTINYIFPDGTVLMGEDI